MQSRLLATGPPRTHVVVMERGDSAVEQLLAFARDAGLQTASITAIGGFSEATLGYFDVDEKRYLDIPVSEQVEVLALTGDIVRGDEDWQLHAHAVLGRRDGGTWGGHLQAATVRPTLEVMVTESPRRVRRRHDPDSGLALIDLSTGSDVTGTEAARPPDQVS